MYMKKLQNKTPVNINSGIYDEKDNISPSLTSSKHLTTSDQPGSDPLSACKYNIK